MVVMVVGQICIWMLAIVQILLGLVDLEVELAVAGVVLVAAVATQEEEAVIMLDIQEEEVLIMLVLTKITHQAYNMVMV